MELQVFKAQETILSGVDASIPILVKIMASKKDQYERKRSPIHLAIIIDTSASMTGIKLRSTIDAVKYIISLLTRNDYLTVITYDTSVNTIVSNQKLSNKDYIKAMLDSIKARGNTNLSGGWIAGLTALKENFIKGHIHRVILLTDGQANQGITDRNKLAEVGKTFFSQGIITTTMGFGKDFNEVILKDIADQSGGSFYFIPDENEIANTFHQEFGDLDSVIAQNLTLSLTLSSGFKIKKIYGDSQGKVDQDGKKFLLGDLRAGEIKQFLFEVSIPEPLPPDHYVIGPIAINFFNIAGDIGNKEQTIQLDINITDKVEEVDQSSEELLKEIWLFDSGIKKLEALKLAQKGKEEDAIRELSHHQEKLTGFSSIDERLQYEKSSIQELIQQLQTGRFDPALKKKIASNVQSQHKGKGDYQKNYLQSMKSIIPCDQPEKGKDYIAYIEQTLFQYAWDKDKVDNVKIVLKELLDNSLRYGCLENDNRVEMETNIAREYVRIVVKDNGPGFDYRSKIIAAGNDVESSQERGRGLQLISKLAYRLSYSNEGRRAEAIVLKDPLSMETHYISTSEDFHISLLEDVVLVKIQGEIDLYNAPSIKEQFSALIDKGWRHHIIEMSGVNYLDSSGIGVLIAISNNTKRINGDIVILNLSPAVKKVFELTKLTSFFQIFDHLDQALQYFS